MLFSTQIINTEILAFTAALIFRLLNHKVLFTNRIENRSYEKVGYFLRK